MTRIKRCHLLLPLFACLALAGGCSPGVKGTRGELGHMRVAWAYGLIPCLFGCNAEGTLALGSEARLNIRKPESIEGLTASSPDGSLDVELSGEVVTITALRMGEGVLEFYRAGELFDRFRWEVSAAQELEMPPLRLVEATDAAVKVDLRSDGVTLLGRGGLEVVPTPENDAVFTTGLNPTSAPLVDLLAASLTNVLVVQAREPGEGILELNAAGGARFTRPVRVVAEMEVDEVQVEVVDSYREEGEGNAQIQATAFVEGEELLTAPCMWTASEGAVIESESRTSEARVSGNGRHTVTCTIGATSASADLQL